MQQSPRNTHGDRYRHRARIDLPTAKGVARLVLAAMMLALMAAFIPMTARAEDSPMTFRLATDKPECTSCAWIAAQGTITDATPGAFRRFMHNNNLVRSRIEVRLSSPGGSLIGGIRLGQAFRNLGVDTRVARTIPAGRSRDRAAGGHCASACVFAFLGGVNRIAGPHELSVHEYSDAEGEQEKPKSRASDDPRERERISAMMRGFVEAMDVDGSLVELSLSVPNDQLRDLTAAELRRLNVATKVEAFKVQYDSDARLRR